MINRYFYNLVSKIIVVMILTLYILFLYMDFCNVATFVTSDHIKYLCILLCFALSIICSKNMIVDKAEYKEMKKDILLLQLGMLITVFADLCLVILNVYTLGILFFCMVQITYALRYTPNKWMVTLKNFFIIFLDILLIYIVVNFFIIKINILLPISLFYAICLLTSVYKSIEAFKDNLYPSYTKYMVVMGMILFLLCDTCVALSNVTECLPTGTLELNNLEQISSYLIWVFYLPSQLLLSLSGSTKIRESKYDSKYIKYYNTLYKVKNR
jgi:hypothetical protein